MTHAVFADIIYTLVHQKEDIEELVNVGESRYIAKRAIDLITQIRNIGAGFILVTGAGERSYNQLKDKIPHDEAIIEQGGIIYDTKGVMDEEWRRKMGVYVFSIETLAAALIERGYSVEKRTTYLRLHRDGTDRTLNKNELEMITKKGRFPSDEQLEIPEGIKSVLHNIDSTTLPPCVDFMPDISGKENAIEYLLSERYKLNWESAICMGDDSNDIGMLKAASFAVVIGNSDYAVRMLVTGKGKNGYISKYSGHKGTIDMLQRIIQYIS